MAKAKVTKKAIKKETSIKISGHTAILVFDMETNSEEYKIAMDGSAMSCALFDIQQELWRPSYKHGYQDQNIAELIKKIDSALKPLGLKDEDGDILCANSLISLLMKKYHSILNDHGVSHHGHGC